MDSNSIVWIVAIAIIILCALIFFNRVSVTGSLTNLKLKANNSKMSAEIENSKKVEIEQNGEANAKIKGSEDIKIKQSEE